MTESIGEAAFHRVAVLFTLIFKSFFISDMSRLSHFIVLHIMNFEFTSYFW